MSEPALVTEADRSCPDRDVALEALRGVAALIVVAWHMMLAFAPSHAGIFDTMDQTHSVNGRWWFGLLNGTGSVTFFFVLSGFVLSRRPLLGGDGAGVIRGALKRWPRLAGPILVVTLFSWALLRLGLYAHVPVSGLTHSLWLQSFGFAATPLPPRASLFSAMGDGLYSTLFRGQQSYDSSLWTMPIEFIGSFLIFGLTLALIAMQGMRAWARLLIVIPIALLCCEVNPFYVAFVAGVGLAALLPRRRMTLSLPLAVPLAMLAAWLAGYSDKVGDFRLLHEALKGLSPVYVQTVSAVIAIMLVETVPSCRRALSGPVARLAGRMSFPVYLLHMPVLCSAGCIAYLELQALPPLAAKSGAAAITLFFTLGLAWPFALLDVWWTGIVSQAVRRIVAVAESVTSEVTSD